MLLKSNQTNTLNAIDPNILFILDVRVRKVSEQISPNSLLKESSRSESLILAVSMLLARIHIYLLTESAIIPF